MEGVLRNFLRFSAVLFVVSLVALSTALSTPHAQSNPSPQQQQPPANAPYRDAKLPVEQRIADLLSRMTLEEKVAQLEGAWENKQFFSDPNQLFVDDKGAFLPDHAAVLLKNGLGEISRPSEHRDPRVMVEFTNSIQKWMKENTRLGIPVLFHDECLHGHVAPKGTSYPTAIALASTWDPALLRRSLHRHRRRSPRPRHPAMPSPGPRPRSRPALGPHRGNLRRRSLPRHPPGRRRHPPATRALAHQAPLRASTNPMSSPPPNISPSMANPKAAPMSAPRPTPSAPSANICSSHSKPPSKKPTSPPSCPPTTRSTASPITATST